MVTVWHDRMAPLRVPTLLAWCCAGLSAAALLTQLIIAPRQSLRGHVYEDAFTALVWAFLALLLLRRSSHPIVRIFLIVAASATLAVATGAYGTLDLPGGLFANWVSGWVWPVSTFVPVTLLPAVFPNGRVHARSLPSLLGIFAIALVALGVATGTTIEVSATRTVPNPLALPWSEGMFLTGSALVVLAAVLAVGDLWWRTARTTDDERRRWAPVAVAATVTLPVLVVAGVLEGPAVWLQLLVAPLVPGAITLAILRHRLYDVELMVRRSLVLAGLSVLVIGGYVLVVQATATLLHRPPGTLGSLLAVGVVALAFEPARSVLQRAVGRLVYGDRDTPGRALGEVSELLTVAAEPGLALQSAVDRLREALAVPWAEVDNEEGPMVSAGSRPSWASADVVQTVPLLNLGVRQGHLTVAPRSPREPLSSRDHQLLHRLAGLVAAVLASQRLVVDLQLSREEVVLAREEERRRVRRDLHDGVGPLLSALTTHLDVASLRLQRDPSTVGELLSQTQEICAEALAALRQVVDGLQPVTLDEMGLTGALGELANTLTTDGIQVEVVGHSGTGLPAAVEVAAYRIVAEAVSNAHRHGGATAVTIRLRQSADGLTVQVSDNGTGIVPEASTGIGLTSMRDRAEEIGGGLAVQTGPGGTMVQATFPLQRHSPWAATGGQTP